MANQKAGEYAFLVGVVVAVLAALGSFAKALDVATAGWVSALLVVLGIVVGVLNVKDKESQPFLVAAIALLVAGTASFAALNTAVANVGTLLDTVVKNLAVLVAPAAVITAVKATWSLASGK
ncbi:MAG: hypothetical protein HYT72_04655 [Candidatus Aenigmarchaeota archaeon]|nr:hypothetical protein [Candidatus Aenigmarchaeota archaeon]